MKLSSVLLATAAGFMLVSGAQAADLPGEPVPAAVDYVKVCDAFGAGFFYIPGTETCLDISGRVRFRVAYDTNGGADDSVLFRADGRVDFDARTASEYGTVRSFFRIADGGNDVDGDGVADRGALIDAAFIQVGYLTVGYNGDIYNGDRLYGINSFDGGDLGEIGDTLQVTVLADDLGGGFYVGASVVSQIDGVLRVRFTDIEGALAFQGVAGVTGQPWGGIDLSLVYAPQAGDDAFAAKLTGDLILAEGFNARLTAAYVDNGPADWIALGAAASYAVTKEATVYAGVAYDIEDGDDSWGANIGVDYTVTPGLVLTGELAYADDGADDNIEAVVQLARTW